MDTGFQLFPKAASTIAHRVDTLYLFMVWLTVIVSVVIATLIVYYAVKYRRANNVDRTRAHTGLWLEMTWILAPLPVLLVIFYWGADIFFDMARPPTDAMEFTVVAKQWMWKFQHPTGQREIDNLHVPTGRAIRFTMISQDVIHSMFVPAFRVKQDVLPGRYTSLWFMPTTPGQYHLFCAEYCGTNHAKMGGTVTVMAPREYQAWLAGGNDQEPPIIRGQKLFEQMRCGSCHLGGGERPRGPPLHQLFGRQVKLANGDTVVADEDYLRESILRPRAKVVAGYEPIMPPFEEQISEEGVLDLIAYIKGMNEAGGVEQSPTGEATKTTDQKQ
jgi:cytochrome c oxidase subunit 2